MIGKCNRTYFAKRIREAHRMPIAAPLQPLRRHLLRLAASSIKHGHCQQAGIEIRQAIQLAKKNPHDFAYWQAVARARGGKLRSR